MVIESADVQIIYVNVKNFDGDGIVIRGDRARLTWVESSANRNGIVVSGSLADIRSTVVLGNTANGIWITAGAVGSQIGVPYTPCYMVCPPFPGPDSVRGNAGAGIRVDGEKTTIDSAQIESNGGDGIIINGPQNKLLNSTISYNRGHGLRLLAPADFEDNFGFCNSAGFIAGPLIEPPRITFARSDPTVFMARGDFHGQPNRNYRIELHYPSTSCLPSERHPGSVIDVRTDATGFAAWSAMVQRSPAPAVTAIAIGEGEISRLADVVAVYESGETRVDLSARTIAPPYAVTEQIIEFITVVTNHGPAAVAGFYVEIPRTAGSMLVSASITSGACWLGGLQFCRVGLLGAGESATIVEQLRVTASSGTLTHTAKVGHWRGSEKVTVDPNRSNDTAFSNVAIVRYPARSRAARH